MSGKDGDDTLVWNTGDGNDVMNGGDGVDTIESNGADAARRRRRDLHDRDRRQALALQAHLAGPFKLDVGGAEQLRQQHQGRQRQVLDARSAGPSTGIAVTLNGGDGNDDLTGTDGNDMVNGGAGNDTLTASRGNDAMNGDDGDDPMVWNNGDGTDKHEGGAGNDIAQHNGGAAGEHFVVTANGRASPPPATTRPVLPRHRHDRDARPQRPGRRRQGRRRQRRSAPLIATDVDLGDGNDSCARATTPRRRSTAAPAATPPRSTRPTS